MINSGRKERKEGGKKGKKYLIVISVSETLTFKTRPGVGSPRQARSRLPPVFIWPVS